jgi:DNA adenine methylase
MKLKNSSEIDSVKPILRWAGSKKKILPTLQRYWNVDFKRYIEPFAGSAQLFFAINARKAIISDINKELIVTYQSVQRDPDSVIAYLSKLRKGKVAYYKVRREGFENMEDSDKAARFIYLNRFCFNGLYRTNKKGEFNVPYSGYKTGALPSRDHIRSVHEKIQKVKFICKDFESVIKENVKENDFIYLDPPFALTNRRIFHQYDPHTFGINDIERLIQTIELIDGRNAKFLLSYAYSEEMARLFVKWKSEIISIPRNIAGFKKHKRSDKELLVTNM